MLKHLIVALGVLGGGAAFAQGDPATPPAPATESAVFAGGCFWCVEEAFDKLSGIVATTSGYTGGTVENPTYQQVSSEETGHFEAVKVEYDPNRVTYEQLLDTFWKNVDPFDPNGQFCDKGSSYLSAIFVEGEEEANMAEASKQQVGERFNMPVATQVLPEKTFYPAEEYHQDYYKKNPVRYNYYKWGCGRAQRLEEIWGKPSA